MKRFSGITLFLALPLYAFQQAPVDIVEYSAAATIDARRSTVDGSVAVWLRVTADSIDRFLFFVPSSYDLDAVRDIDDDRFSYREVRQEENRTFYSVELPSHRYRNDSLFVRIAFDGVLDSSSHRTTFVNGREFILEYRAGAAWLPRFEASHSSRTLLRFAVEKEFFVVADRPADSTAANNQEQISYFSLPYRAPLGDLFTLCGSTTLTQRTKKSTDSLVTISLFSDPARFHGQFADSLLSFLVDAAVFAMDLTGRHTSYRQHFVFIGSDNIGEETVTTTSGIIERNSPAFTVFDTTVFRRSIRNPWLTHVGRNFCLTHSDSLALFDDSWSGYLATRYILSQHRQPETERRERLDLIINALSFYPANPLSAGRKYRLNEAEVLSFKGRYVFLMLEHLLGTPSFDSVIRKAFDRSPDQSVSVNEFRMLCEEEYGSSLNWFFHQWLNRSTVPEYVFQWSAAKTERGIAMVTVIVEQRGDVFVGPLTFYFSFGQKKIPKRIFVERAKQEFSFPFPSIPGSVELDPDYALLRWLLDIRILAHARSSRLFRVFDKDVSSSEREALLTLQLDPANATGSAPIAYFSLGKLAVIEQKPEKAKEYFIKGMQSRAVEEASLYPLMCLVRYANVLEMEGNRAEAIPLYERAAAEGNKDPSLFAPVIIEAQTYLRTPFISSDEVWYGLY